MTALPPDVVDDLRQENARLQAELRAARERQNASAEILAAIAGTSGDADRALQQIAETTERLFGASSVTLLIAEGERWGRTFRVGAGSERIAAALPLAHVAIVPRFMPGAVYLENRQVHVADIDDPAAIARWPGLVPARTAGSRTVSGTPLRREGRAVGALIVHRDRLEPFTADELALQQSFADQAAIAIENARLFNETEQALHEVEERTGELAESLQNQIATSEVLNVISRSQGDIQPVFDAIVNSAAKLFEPCAATITTLKDGKLHWNATATLLPDFDIERAKAVYPFPFEPDRSPSARAILDRRIIEIPDVAAPDTPEFTRKAAAAGGFRSATFVPLVNQDHGIGTIILTRPYAGFRFSEKQLAIVRTFADQAVIAIENARLFNETKEALSRQTATSDILRVISGSPTDVQPVFDAIVLTALRLLRREMAFILVCDGTAFRAAAIAGTEGTQPILNPGKVPIDPDANFPSRAILSRKNVHLPDWSVIELPDYERHIREIYGLNSALYLPLLRDGECIGVLGIGGKQAGMFGETEITLAESFRDQALIAIENARLFNETEQALSRQTATSDILRVISQSPTNVQPVFDAIVLTAVRLLRCDRSFIQRCDGATFWTVARAGPEGPLPIPLPEKAAIDPDANFPSRAIVAKKTLHLPDWSAIELPEFERRIRETLGYNSTLYLPLLREGECIGLLGMGRKQAGIFDESEIALAESFRDQALIAIENTRLFNETQEALERQNASAEILRTIAATPGDAGRSLQQIAETSARLFGAPSVSIQLVEDGKWANAYRFGEAAQRIRAAVPLSEIQVGGRNLPGAVVGENRQINIPDLDHLDASFADFPGLPHARAGGTRAICGTPLRREGKAIGAFIIHRDRPVPFTQEELALQQSFADQAVIAIENARLFNETREALERQTATSDILRVISQSPTDVQPVFEAIAERSNRLVDGLSTAVFRLVDDTMHLEAFTPTSPAADAALKAMFPRPVSELAWAEQTRRGEIVHNSDTEIEPISLRELARLRGFRSRLMVPLLRDRVPIGLISVTRKEPGAFADHHVQLLQTFADQAVIAIENVRLFNETREALERQTATADILRVIASSPSDVQPVFDVIVERAVRLCGGRMGRVYRYDGDLIHMVAGHGLSTPGLEKVQEVFPRPAADDTTAGLAIRSRRPYFVTDIQSDHSAPPLSRQMIEALGTRSQVTVPMLRAREPIGAITVGWAEPAAYGDQQVALLQTFADQAVIAIENVRLFNETREALERQTATADILKVIASSPSDVQPVFEAIAASANRLIGGFSSTVFRFIDGIAHLKAFTPTSPDADEVLQATFPRPAADFPPFQMAQAGEVTQIPDTEALSDEIRNISRARGFRSMLFTPLMNDGESIGFIAVTRLQPGNFADHHVQLLRTFSDQAVIAIENVRLFEEVQAKTRDLTEALTYQTGSSNILRVIASSPTDVGPVLEAIVDSACELCASDDAVLHLRRGDELHYAAHRGSIPVGLQRRTINRNFVAGRSVVDKMPIHLHDVLAVEGADFPEAQEMSRRLGTRTVLSVPLLREGEGIGTIVLRRSEVKPFNEKQVALLQNFADQAVIAIGNVRLFDEVQARTRELTESLEQQTATSEVLSVISSSAGDLVPVFDAMLGKAMQLCRADFGVLNTFDGELFHTAATYGLPPAYDKYRRSQPLDYGPDTAPARLLRGEPMVEIADLIDSDAYRNGEPNRRALVDVGGARCLLAVPLLKDDRVVGNVMIFRQEKQPFSEKQITLLKQFAAQAVIAIENTRLLRELRESTEDLSESLQQQTATADVLKVISRSVFNLQTVLDTLVESAYQLCGASLGLLYLRDDDAFECKAIAGEGVEGVSALFKGRPIRAGRGTAAERVIMTGEVQSITDFFTDPDFDPRAREVIGNAAATGSSVGKLRSTLAVPMTRDGIVIGVLVIARPQTGPFPRRQVELLQTFADQAVIAIENARLFDEVQERTRELTEALTYQTGSANILRVIASSPTEVGPVLNAIAESACELCEAVDALVLLKDGDNLRHGAHHGPIPYALEEWSINRNWASARAFLDRKPVHVLDMLSAEGDEFPDTKERARRTGTRTYLCVPLLREGESIGTIVLRRAEVRAFSDKQIALLQTFADQAVIAIGNVRLFEQVQQRTRELSQSLDDLRTAQDRLVQTEKLASLGQLTAGIAHEIKNPLNFVNNFAALSAELTDELNEVLSPVVVFDDKTREEVDEITQTLKDNLQKVVQHGKRADSIVKNMLLHSREGSGEHRPADINALVDESLNLAYHGARAEKPQFNVTLQRDLDPEAGMIEVFPQEITRVFLNLISNGFYAVTKRKMENGGSGFEPVISATTRNLGDTVEVRIRDNGTGIPAEVKEKMFNPFFTTKPAGEGTGLGLSMSHDIIVKQHGGTIDVETEPGQFTEFRIVLSRTSNPSNRNRGQT